MKSLWEAAAAWQGIMKGLLTLERKTPPGKLSLSDLRRLVAAKGEELGALLVMGEDLAEEFPLLGRRSVAGKLLAMVQQAGKARDYSIMLAEVLQLYGEAENIASQVDLSEQWREQDTAKLRALDKEMQRVVVLSLPPNWQEQLRGMEDQSLLGGGLSPSS